MAIVLVEQYFDFAYGLADRFYVLKRGAVAMSGTKAEIAEADPARGGVGLNAARPPAASPSGPQGTAATAGWRPRPVRAPAGRRCLRGSPAG